MFMKSGIRIFVWDKQFLRLNIKEASDSADPICSFVSLIYHIYIIF